MAVSKSKEETEPLLKGIMNSKQLHNDNNNQSGNSYTEIECDSECDDDPETIRRTAGVCGEAFSHRRLSSASSQDAFSEYSSSNGTSVSFESDQGSLTNGNSKLRFWTSIITFTISSFLGGIAVSMLVPFYTKEAEEKHVTVSEAGMVFGSVNFVQILFIPLFGKYLQILKAHRLFVIGLFVCGVSNIGFGCLELADERVPFLTLSFVIRIISAIGEAAFLTSLYPLATKTSSERYRSTILSMMETAFGIGMTTGPAVGGILYKYQGFYFPFVVVGGLLLSCSLISALIIDSNDNDKVEDYQSLEGGLLHSKAVDTTFRKLFSTAAISVPFVILILSEMSVAWFLPTLEPFLRETFGSDSTLSGIMFSLEGLTYAGFSPLFGILLDRGLSPYTTMMIGVSCQIIGLSLLGPARYFDFIPKSPYTTGIGLFILGTGIAASFIVTLTYMLSETPKADRKIRDTEHTREMITSLWLIAENIGGWLGSFCGGIAYDHLGFEKSSLVIIGLQGIIIIGVPYLYYRSKSNERRLNAIVFDNVSISRRETQPMRNNAGAEQGKHDENTPLLRKM